MNCYEAVFLAARRSGRTLEQIASECGLSSNAISNGASRGSTPRCDTAAGYFDACGYSLAAVPRDDVPDTALVIDPKRRPKATS